MGGGLSKPRMPDPRCDDQTPSSLPFYSAFRVPPLPRVPLFDVRLSLFPGLLLVTSSSVRHTSLK